MNGLVAYDYDSPSDSEAGPSTTRKLNANDKSTKGEATSKSALDARKLPKAQVIIKRPSTSLKHQPRAHISDDILPDNPPATASTSQTTAAPTPAPLQSNASSDELAQLRAALRPPAIPGTDDWGIPPASTEPCDAALMTKLTTFTTLKHSPTTPKHFNDSLMSHRSFRNPHLYAQLVDFADVDERATNFPKDVWDPSDVRGEWFADQIADAQKERSEKQSAAQATGKRSRIDFSSSSTSARSHNPQHPQAHPQQHAYATGALGGAPPPKKSRFQPYGHAQSYSTQQQPSYGGGAPGAVSGISSSREPRPGTRWG